MARVLGVGIATLDIINTVGRYPAEDDEVRALDQRLARGGNASNTLAVLAQLGHSCGWAGVVTTGANGRLILDDLTARGIDVSARRTEEAGAVPTSCITLSRESGSRTIVHYRDLPEYGFEDFSRIDLAPFEWLHFEGRNVPETYRMLERARALCPNIPRSVEVEKPRPDIESLFEAADVLLFSRHYARENGYTDGDNFVHAMRQRAPHATLVCAWGRHGACGLSRQGDTCASPAFAPERVVDTLGAGDVFNAGVIHGLLEGSGLAAALTGACQLAGRKCGQYGLDGLIPRP